MTEAFEPGTEVQADEELGGYVGTVVRPHGTFEGIEGTNWRTCTQIQVTDPGHPGRWQPRWEPGQLVNVETCYLRRRQP